MRHGLMARTRASSGTREGGHASRVSIRPELRSFVETPDRYTETGDDVRRVDDGRACVLYGARFAAVSGVDVDAGDLPRLVADVRALVPAGAKPMWLLGPSTRPPDAGERLRALGLTTPVDRVATLHGLALTTAPPAVDAVEVRRVDALEDFLASMDVQWETFATAPERRAGATELAAIFRVWQERGHLVSFLGLVDGRPAASARLIRSPRGGFLVGGCVAPWARGRGLYRALVRARYDEAAAWGAPALVTHAAPDTSLPILLRLGFEEVCAFERLEDARPPG
jgi:hypothetical protein